MMTEERVEALGICGSLGREAHLAMLVSFRSEKGE